MHVMPFNPGPGGNSPKPVALHCGRLADGSLGRFLEGSNDFLPAGLTCLKRPGQQGKRRCLWFQIVNKGQRPCCPRHKGLLDPAVQDLDVADMAESLKALDACWYWCQHAEPEHGSVHDFISVIIIPAAEVSSAQFANLELAFDKVQPRSATQVAAKLQDLKIALANQATKTHLHVAVLVDRLPVLSAAPVAPAAAVSAALMEADEPVTRSLVLLAEAVAALQLQLQQLTTELAAGRAANYAC